MMGAYNARFLSGRASYSNPSTPGPDPVVVSTAIEGLFVQGEMLVAGDNLDGLYCRSVSLPSVPQIAEYPNGLMVGSEYLFLTNGSIIEVVQDAVMVGSEYLYDSNSNLITVGVN